MSSWRRKLAFRQREKRVGVKASSVDFSRLDIFERDAWTCGICGALIDRDLEYPHPMSASLDHIVPLPKGPHMRANVRAAHLICNTDHIRDAKGRFTAAA